MRRALSLWLTIPFAFLTACSSIGSKPPSGALTSAATFDYVMPETTVKVGLNITIEECASPTPDNVKFNAEITPTVSAIAGPTSYHLVGGDLSSWWTSHDISITKYDDGSIKTLNSTDSNRALAAFTNIVKDVASLATLMAGSPNPNGLKCSMEVLSALHKVGQLKAAIARAQDLLATASGRNAADLTSAINAYAAEVARITTTAPIRFTLPAQPVLFDREANFLVWTRADVPKDSFEPASITDGEFNLYYCVKRQSAAVSTPCELKTKARDTVMSTPMSAAPNSCGDDTTCTHTIVMREPKIGVLTLIYDGQAWGNASGHVAKVASIPVAQWGDFTLLSASVGLAETRTIGFSLDEYGAKTSFTWKSDARAESISGGLSSALDATNSMATSLRDPELAAKKNELDSLQTDQKPNQMKACKAVIEAGGFTCPAN